MGKIVVENEVFFTHVREMLDTGRRVTIPVKGYSMLPFIRGEKDLVILEKAGGDLSEGDIVLFYVGEEPHGRYILHRILSIDGNRVEIMGDGVVGSRERVARERIYAKVVSILRNGKREVDPESLRERRKACLWRKLLPVRRYLLFAYRHLPWNRKWLKKK
ncbi:MAG: S24/S26 family peptidase [Bacteroidales bacterium]|nr:S24/S26 family peptidase [Bacteroidales bacterium]